MSRDHKLVVISQHLISNENNNKIARQFTFSKFQHTQMINPGIKYKAAKITNYIQISYVCKQIVFAVRIHIHILHIHSQHLIFWTRSQYHPQGPSILKLSVCLSVCVSVCPSHYSVTNALSGLQRFDFQLFDQKISVEAFEFIIYVLRPLFPSHS